MNYSKALRCLHSFTNLEKLAQFPKNPFFNLKRMEHLLRIGDHPEKKFFPVLIAGTTGKGSTGFFLESILKANGIRAGYYHSPHVEDARERIRLGGEMASAKLWAEGLSRVREKLLEKPVPSKLGVLTYFEILTFLAIWIFARTGMKVGIFEVGLGGRLDATNILKARLVILTPIHLDHEAFLGSTIAKIAAEKAAILKPFGHTVIGKQYPEALKVIRHAVKTTKGTLWQARPVTGIPLGLAGDFQKMNAGVALRAAGVLRECFGMSIVSELSQKGLQSQGWTGRLESFRRGGRSLILDGAHNPISMKALIQALRASRKKEAWLVFGAMSDKNSREMFRILSRFFSKVILTRISGNRAKPLGMLLAEAKGLFNCLLTAQNVREAFDLVKKASKPGMPIVVTGSFYLVGEARKLLK